MADQAIIERITKLLRLARDQEGTPEGKTAASLAQLLMRRVGVIVELQEREEEESKWVLLTADSLPVPWKEYLGLTLTTAYRCECRPRWAGVAWQLWAFSDEKERASSCRDHFEYLRHQVAHRLESMTLKLRRSSYLPCEHEALLKSYADGLVYIFAKRLLVLLGWDGDPPFVDVGFDLELFMAQARDPLGPDDDEIEDDPETSQEPGIVPYRYRAPADHVVDDDPQEPPPVKIFALDQTLFAYGQKDGQYLLLFPSRLAHAFH